MQLKTEKERARRSLITGNHDIADESSDRHAEEDAIVIVMNSTSDNNNNSNLPNADSILPVVSITTNLTTQKSIADEFTLNREQRAAFMIITSHLNGDSQYRTGISII